MVENYSNLINFVTNFRLVDIIHPSTDSNIIIVSISWVDKLIVIVVVDYLYRLDGVSFVVVDNLAVIDYPVIDCIVVMILMMVDWVRFIVISKKMENH